MQKNSHYPKQHFHRHCFGFLCLTPIQSPKFLHQPRKHCHLFIRYPGHINIDRRANTLDEHIRQGEIYLQHRGLYGQYQQLKSRKQAAFHEANRAELVLFESAKRYLDTCLNGHTLPLEAWKKERKKLIVERSEFSLEYAAIKEQILDMETIQRVVERILREGKQPQKARGR